VSVLAGTGGIGIWKYFTMPLTIYLVSMFFFGIERELSHNLYDFDVDKKAGLSTFGQIAGRRTTKTIIRIMKGFFLISMVGLGWTISFPVSVLALLFSILGIAGVLPADYFFSLLAVGLIISGETGPGEIMLLFCMIPSLLRIITRLAEKTRAGIHLGRAAVRRAINDIHAQHRELIFTIFERIK